MIVLSSRTVLLHVGLRMMLVNVGLKLTVC